MTITKGQEVLTCSSLLQHSGRFYEELPNTADYVSYRLACNKEDYPEPYSPPINPPLSFLPQQPYQSHTTTATSSSTSAAPSKNTFSPPSHTTAVFKYPSVQGLPTSPPPGVAAYTFPKEQYVWGQTPGKLVAVATKWTLSLDPDWSCGAAPGPLWSSLLWKSHDKSSSSLCLLRFFHSDRHWLNYVSPEITSNWLCRVLSWCWWPVLLLL